ncbi:MULTISPECIES: BlaI/MecI/CopY family transcriptional regulator [Nocardia]|uniref:BlaI/MecI/CopY family transcriptional regulator n=1 Tax=Nocardia TaxID=1817 RepID=UPI0018930317|nr:MULTISPECIES: BlaI/MecI/CopY family transcriptional regulator [Nocardia]MBF6348467.1 BlaI/MecI/CopY family transcriptional regulator [Nocardia flavorosea]
MVTGKRRDQQSEPVRLGALEQQVMDVLWDHGAATIRQVITRLGGDLAYTTIATVLANLERKALVAPQREGRSVRYVPRHTREKHAAQLMKQALSTSNDPMASILHFIDEIDQRDVQLLRDYLDKSGRRG